LLALLRLLSACACRKQLTFATFSFPALALALRKKKRLIRSQKGVYSRVFETE
jgi:hypothetical protein